MLKKASQSYRKIGLRPWSLKGSSPSDRPRIKTNCFSIIIQAAGFQWQTQGTCQMASATWPIRHTWARSSSHHLVRWSEVEACYLSQQRRHLMDCSLISMLKGHRDSMILKAEDCSKSLREWGHSTVPTSMALQRPRLKIKSHSQQTQIRRCLATAIWGPRICSREAQERVSSTAVSKTKSRVFRLQTIMTNTTE